MIQAIFSFHVKKGLKYFYPLNCEKFQYNHEFRKDHFQELVWYIPVEIFSEAQKRRAMALTINKSRFY